MRKRKAMLKMLAHCKKAADQLGKGYTDFPAGKSINRLNAMEMHYLILTQELLRFIKLYYYFR